MMLGHSYQQPVILQFSTLSPSLYFFNVKTASIFLSVYLCSTRLMFPTHPLGPVASCQCPTFTWEKNVFYGSHQAASWEWRRTSFIPACLSRMQRTNIIRDEVTLDARSISQTTCLALDNLVSSVKNIKTFPKPQKEGLVCMSLLFSNIILHLT